MEKTKTEYRNIELTDNHRCILDDLPCDMESMITTFRWIDFLLHRVKRERLAQLMNYYQEIGWIGPRAKAQVISIARGTVQDANTFENEGEVFTEAGTAVSQGLDYQKVNDFRLTATDHIKTLMFIMKIVGEPGDNLDANEWESETPSFGGL
jgi:flagellar protein FlaD